jgi:hypothetical protein
LRDPESVDHPARCAIRDGDGSIRNRLAVARLANDSVRCRVITRRRAEGVLAASLRIADIVGARVAVTAVDWSAAPAASRGIAGVACRAGLLIVALGTGSAKHAAFRAAALRGTVDGTVVALLRSDDRTVAAVGDAERRSARTDPAAFDPAVRRAAIRLDEIAVVASFCSVERSVAADRPAVRRFAGTLEAGFDAAAFRAAVIIAGVPVVARFVVRQQGVAACGDAHGRERLNGDRRRGSCFVLGAHQAGIQGSARETAVRAERYSQQRRDQRATRAASRAVLQDARGRMWSQ